MFWAYLGPPETKPLLPRIDGFVADGTDPHARQDADSGELAPDHGELARPDPHRMAARPHLRVRQGAAGQGPQGRDQRAPREDRVREFEHGITKHRLLAGHSEDSDDWKRRPPGDVPEHPVGRQRRRGVALLRVPDPRAGRRHPHAAPLVHRLRAAEGREGRSRTARQSLRLRRAAEGQERRIHRRQHRRPGHDGLVHARVRSPTAPRRTSAPPTTASRSTAACSAARSRRSRRASTRCSPSATPATNSRIDLPNERKKHHNSDGMRSWIMRTHAAYSPIADDVCRMFEAEKPAPAPLRVVS